jgi:hypothetical protein
MTIPAIPRMTILATTRSNLYVTDCILYILAFLSSRVTSIGFRKEVRYLYSGSEDNTVLMPLVPLTARHPSIMLSIILYEVKLEVGIKMTKFEVWDIDQDV